MRKLRFNGMNIGLESGHTQTLKLLKKGYDADEAKAQLLRLPQDKDRLLAALEKGIKARSEEFFPLARKEAPRAGMLAKNLTERKRI